MAYTYPADSAAIAASFADTAGNPYSYPADAAAIDASFVTEAIYRASGWLATNFGTPTLSMVYAVATMGRITHFGAPSTPTYREFQVAGFAATNFGLSVLMQYLPGNLNRTFPAVGWRATRFGRPTLGGSLQAQASGWLATHFGTGEVEQNRIFQASGIAPAGSFGAPSLGMTLQATGFRSIHFGAGTLARYFGATSLGMVTRFGTPTYARSGQHEAYGWMATRFGHGSLQRASVFEATGFRPTHFGTPSCHFVFRATPLVATARFGTPQLERNPKC